MLHHTDELSVHVVVVAFADRESLVGYQRRQRLEGLLVLSDPDRRAYEAFGLGRGSVLHVWLDPRVSTRYAKLLLPGDAAVLADERVAARLQGVLVGGLGAVALPDRPAAAARDSIAAGRRLAPIVLGGLGAAPRAPRTAAGLCVGCLARPRGETTRISCEDSITTTKPVARGDATTYEPIGSTPRPREWVAPLGVAAATRCRISSGGYEMPALVHTCASSIPAVLQLASRGAAGAGWRATPAIRSVRI